MVKIPPLWSKSSTVKDTCLFKVCWEKREKIKILKFSATPSYLEPIFFVSFSFFYESFPIGMSISLIDNCLIEIIFCSHNSIQLTQHLEACPCPKTSLLQQTIAIGIISKYPFNNNNLAPGLQGGH